MSDLTKAQIDALVDGMPNRMKTVVGMAGVCAGTTEGVEIAGVGLGEVVSKAGLRRSLYLAAGLTATGERKPERIRCWMITSDGDAPWFTHIPPAQVRLRADPRVTPGWFVPSEEGET